ncbi:glycoside hydrolase family 3 protein [Phanerochaete carnosa HHB-10118-sp]|uniref:Glycoside hydrolase family 3 protein n=1 Tax=Phanerochaete carnosa (strain HHB-10118-sp) TaxID=650164 RepID=K5WQK4_PHACS|nr:glycoside hydrolase family 3 protein [Phanerochaete carnosa HHB-10118-sp]EKM52642.1 glycoside hydrolase family 3 protein [Phanerochaete carnosa HHB-10118-sp]
MAELNIELKREVGQHFVFGFHGHGITEDIRQLIQEYHVGNVIIMKRNVRDIMQLHSLIRGLQKLAQDAGHPRPLMIGTDQENGLVSAFSSPECGTQFPGAMALAATGSIDIADKVTGASAMEMRNAGINWVYSPIADVNSDPRNPVIGVRSFGDDPQKVSRFVNAVSKGLTRHKIAPSAKHFPGHGNTHIDSHLSLPRIMQTSQALAATELVPFQSLIDNGVATIMTGHMALPLITGADTPCSLSRMITSDLLRDQMGFQGVIVTDCLEMEAVAEKYGSEDGAVMALQAGADVVMICHTMQRQRGAVERTYAAITKGNLSTERLLESGKRIAALKDTFAGSWDDVLAPPMDLGSWSTLKNANTALSKQAYTESMTLIRDPNKVLPLPENEGPIMVFTPIMESVNLAVDDAEGLLRDAADQLRNTAGPSYTAFAAAISKRTTVHHAVYSSETTVSPSTQEYLQRASAVVFATRNGFENGRWQIECLKRVIAKAGQSKKIVLVSTCAPYDVLGVYLDGPVAVLATMEFTVPALETAVETIFGAVQARGVVPVQSV